MACSSGSNQGTSQHSHCTGLDRCRTYNGCVTIETGQSRWTHSKWNKKRFGNFNVSFKGRKSNYWPKKRPTTWTTTVFWRSVFSILSSFFFAPSTKTKGNCHIDKTGVRQTNYTKTQQSRDTAPPKWVHLFSLIVCIRIFENRYSHWLKNANFNFPSSFHDSFDVLTWKVMYRKLVVCLWEEGNCVLNGFCGDGAATGKPNRPSLGVYEKNEFFFLKLSMLSATWIRENYYYKYS